MTRGLTVTMQVHFRQGRGRRKVLGKGEAPKKAALGTVPRLSRLMALALQMQDLLNQGVVADYADLARLALVSRARMTQVMNLLNLAPDIQEEILFLPPADGGRDPIGEHQVRPIAGVVDWRKQRAMREKVKSKA